ncbi:hypothetical protein CU026_0551 [Enterococcus faecium]|nr:hypothetical protein [Enterococcus faecium]MBK4751920.1 hypothetical protein [Enterococcus faecium]MBK4762553.1 hypothetical protein [Enterococcus faecium]MBK4789362.1 hypothetical protein [Enterococcus faecium]MBK4797756.1 hypothetical protein [Enterococcus faecium]
MFLFWKGQNGDYFCISSHYQTFLLLLGKPDSGTADDFLPKTGVLGQFFLT